MWITVRPKRSALLRLPDLQCLDTVSRDKPLFAFLHWGQEYATEPGPREEALISVLQGKGVELIMGCHSHRAGPFRCRQPTCVAFSLGNFIFDQTPTRYFRSPAGGHILPPGNLFSQVASFGELICGGRRTRTYRGKITWVMRKISVNSVVILSGRRRSIAAAAVTRSRLRFQHPGRLNRPSYHGGKAGSPGLSVGWRLWCWEE